MPVARPWRRRRHGRRRRPCAPGRCRSRRQDVPGCGTGTSVPTWVRSVAFVPMALRDDAVRAAEVGLSPAERRVVHAVISDPSRVAFGTVAELADRSSTSGPTVVRVARKLGYDGYRELQAAAQEELGTAADLAPAAARIRATAAKRDDPIGRTLAAEITNVEA